MRAAPGRLRVQLQQATRDYRQQMDSILTPEQKSKTVSLRGLVRAAVKKANKEG